MKKITKVGLTVVPLALVLAIIAMAIYINIALPNAGPTPVMTINATPERVEHGKYLANNVMMCMDCHSQRDYSKFAAPMVPGTLGKGGELFGKRAGFPGNFYAPNLTPYNLGNWTDGEIFHAITAGVSKDGHPLFPVMPYHGFGQLDREDIYDIIAYVRSLPPIENEVPASKPAFPMNYIIRTMPHAPVFSSRPDPDDMIAYGKYMVTAGACADCHTKKEKGEPVPGMYMAGGAEFGFPDGTVVRSLNLTPDKTTGIGSWTAEQFIERFKLFRDSSFAAYTVKPGQFKTVMPWTFYAGMKEDDLRAIFAYLQSLPAVKNPVVKFSNHPLHK